MRNLELEYLQASRIGKSSTGLAKPCATPLPKRSAITEFGDAYTTLVCYPLRYIPSQDAQDVLMRQFHLTLVMLNCRVHLPERKRIVMLRRDVVVKISQPHSFNGIAKSDGG